MYVIVYISHLCRLNYNIPVGFNMLVILDLPSEGIMFLTSICLSICSSIAKLVNVIFWKRMQSGTSVWWCDAKI